MSATKLLEGLGLQQYAAKFGLNDIDENVLPLLTQQDLLTIGVASLGHQKLILDAAARLKEQIAPEFAHLPENAERRQLTMLFCDLVGYTELAERLDPEELSKLIEAFREVCRTTVTDYRGTIVNFMGDGIMAAFGYPQSFENDAARAVDAAIDLLERLKSVSSPDGKPVQARAGLNSGIVVVGETAAKTDVDRIVVVGSAPNRAARVQKLAQPGEVLISESTRRLCRGRHSYEDRHEHTLKGLNAPIHLWRATRGEGTEISRTVHGLPMAGREAELAILNACWERAIAHDGRCIVVEGEAGIGKSRLIWELRESILSHNHALFEFRAEPLMATNAYQVLTAHIVRSTGLTRESSRSDCQRVLAQALDCDPASSELGRLVAMVGQVAPTPDDDQPPAAFREWLFEVFRKRIERVSGDRPALIVLDDAQWIDPSSRDFFTSLLEWCKDRPALIIIQSRPGLAGSWPELDAVERVTLAALPNDAVVGLLAGFGPLHQPNSAQRSEIAERAGGNPYFAMELARAQAGEGGRQIPGTLLETLAARIDDAGAARETLMQAACFGLTFSAGILARISGLSASTIEAHLAALTEAKIIARVDPSNPDCFAFQHALLQETAYQLILRAQRRQTHAQVAAILSQDTSEEAPQVVAWHYRRAEDPTKAAEWWYRGAEASLAVGGYREALEVLGEARKALASVPEDQKDGDLLRLELRVLTAMGSTLLTASPEQWSEVKDTYDAAFALTLRTDSAPETGPVLFGLAVYFFFRGELGRTQTLCGQLVELAQKLEAHDMAAGAMLMMQQSNFWRGDVGKLLENEEHLLPPRDLMPEGGAHIARYAQDPQITARITHVWALNVAGRHEDASAEADWGMNYAQRLDHPFTMAQANQMLGWHHLVREDIPSANAAAGRMLELCQQHGMFMILDIAMVQSLFCKDMMGEIADGYDQIAEIVDRWIATGTHLAVRVVSALLLRLALRHERVDEGLQRANATLAMTQSEDRLYDAELTQLKAQILAAGGAPAAEVAATFDAALTMADDNGLKLLALRAAKAAADWAQENKDANLAKYESLIDEILEAYPQPGEVTDRILHKNK